MNFITELDYKIGQNIKNIRIKLNLSSLHLGDYLNVSSSFIRSVENGKSKYNIRHIYLIIALFYKLIIKDIYSIKILLIFS